MECTASASMPAEPVSTKPTIFEMAIPRLATKAATIGSSPVTPTLQGPVMGTQSERFVNVPDAATIYGAGKVVGRVGEGQPYHQRAEGSAQRQEGHREGLPLVLALDPELRSALKGPISPDLQASLNRKLEKINGAAQSSTLELLDRTV